MTKFVIHGANQPEFQKWRWPATTLVEVCVTMVLIALVSGFATLTFLNVVRSRPPMLQVRATILVQECAIRTKKEKTFRDEVVELEEGSIHKRVLPSALAPDLVVLEISFRNHMGRLGSQHREILYLHASSDN